jgi:RNA polymerase sigma-B factor
VEEHRLVLQHLGLARSLARRFANRGEELNDLVQVAMMGLVKAAHRFDPALENQFSTYATATISGELKRHFRDKRWGLHVARSAQERYLLVRDALEWATADLGRSPTPQEVADRAGISLEMVLEAHEVASAFHVGSLDAPAGVDGDDAPTRAVAVAEPGFGGVETRMTVESLTQRLPELEREILRMRFVDEMTQAEIAAEVGVSQMQISRILARTLADLRIRLRRD